MHRAGCAISDHLEWKEKVIMHESVTLIVTFLRWKYSLCAEIAVLCLVDKENYQGKIYKEVGV